MKIKILSEQEKRSIEPFKKAKFIGGTSVLSTPPSMEVKASYIFGYTVPRKERLEALMLELIKLQLAL